MMRKYHIIFLLVSLSFYGQNCSMLKDGNYKTVYDNQVENFETFEIIQGKYYAKIDGAKKGYEIRKLDECSFEILNDDVVDESKLTEFQRMLRKQKIYFEIIKVENEIYYFVCRLNLHVECGKGKFVKN